MKTKVSLIRCNSHNSQDVYDAVKACVDLLGGISSIVRSDARVLVKPNLLAAKPPESGIDTHPEVVRAVISLVKEAGGHVQVGDSKCILCLCCHEFCPENAIFIKESIFHRIIRT